PGASAEQAAGIEAEARRLHKALPRKSRDSVHALAAAFIERPRGFDAAAFLWALHAGAVRSALLTCGDPEAALHETAALYGPRSRELTDLVRFLLADDYAKLREALGWA